MDWSGRPAPLLHPPHYALRLLGNSVAQSRALAEDLGIPGDDAVYATLREFEAALASLSSESGGGFVQSIAPLIDRAGLPPYDLAADRQYADYARHFALDPDELAVYRSAQAAFAALGQLVGPRLGKAAAAYRGSRDGAVKEIERYSLDGLDAAAEPGLWQVDVDVHIAEASGMSWPVMRAELILTQRVFARHGVHIRVRLARKIRVPGEWHSLTHGTRTGPPGAENTPFYQQLQAERAQLSELSERAYRAIIDPGERPEVRVHLVCLREGRMPYYLTDEGGTRLREYPVGGLSFPPYVFADRIARPLRGVIGLFAVRASARQPVPYLRPKTIAHELGHKLLNVSHEGYRAGPEFESYTGGSRDLMLYGFGLDIPAGRDGRWHRERLVRSPFLYRVEADRRVDNPDFQAGGVYDDPAYGQFVVSE